MKKKNIVLMTDLCSIKFLLGWMVLFCSNDTLAGSLENSFQIAFEQEQLLWSGFLSIVAGFFTALSPCVYPMIPITLSMLGARQVRSHLHGFTIAFVYVLGMMLLYSVLGVLFASLGWLAGSALQSPWVIVFLAFFFIVLSLNMFQAFEFALPQSVLGRISKVGGEGYKGAFLMGLLSGVIAAPCTGPVLTFILTLLAKDGDIVRGTLLMFLFSLGLGIPFLILGTFSFFLARIPKSGPWMNMIKNAFGIAMMSVALYYLQLAFKPLYHFLGDLKALGMPMLALFILGGLVLGAMRFSFRNQTVLSFLSRGFGVLLMVFSFNGLALTLDSKNKEWVLISDQEQALAVFEQKIEEAKKQKKPVIIDFYADWCVSCKELDRKTYADVNVQKALSRFVLIKVDVTRETKALNQLQKQFQIVGLPTILFIDSQGVVQKSSRLFGFVGDKEFLSYLESIQ